MKKNCIIFVFVVIVVMAFVLFSNYKTLKNRNTWNKNIFTQCNKMPEEKILCVSNDSAVHLFDNNKSHAYISNNILDILKDAPKYPKGFQAVRGQILANKVNNGKLLDNLRKVEPCNWKKVFKNGYDKAGNKISIHYFESESKKVFDVKVIDGWSTR